MLLFCWRQPIDGTFYVSEKMDRSEALRAIELDQIEYIQCRVKVDFDNRAQRPVGFSVKGKTYTVDDVLYSFKTLADLPTKGYLVKVTGDSVFCLYSQLESLSCRTAIAPCFWVLSFRIQNDHELLSWSLEDRKMLVNISLERMVSFHGHVCPELVIGGKFCEFVQSLFNSGQVPVSGFSVISENATSALDAIQVLLGATVGNQRLQVMDYGKHNYTLLSRAGQRGWQLKHKNIIYGDEESFADADRKIRKNEAELDDFLAFQRMIDARVRRILSLSPEELFSVEQVENRERSVEATSVYLTCRFCKERVLAGHCIRYKDMMVCTPCFQQLSLDCSTSTVQ